MAIEILQWDIGIFKAAADLSDYQHCFVTLSAADTANMCGAGATILGVLQNKPAAAGRACEIRRAGISKLTAGETLAVGDKLKSDSAGRGVTASTGNMYGGICLEVATVGKTTSILIEIGTM